jgi:hypothetical protein
MTEIDHLRHLVLQHELIEQRHLAARVVQARGRGIGGQMVNQLELVRIDVEGRDRAALRAEIFRESARRLADAGPGRSDDENGRWFWHRRACRAAPFRCSSGATMSISLMQTLPSQCRT